MDSSIHLIAKNLHSLGKWWIHSPQICGYGHRNLLIPYSWLYPQLTKQQNAGSDEKEDENVLSADSLTQIYAFLWQ